MAAQIPTNGASGDFFTLGPSATDIFRYWPWLSERFYEISAIPDLIYRKHSGEHIIGPYPCPHGTGRFLLRPHLHEILMEEIKAIGIPIHFDRKAVRYFEDEERGGVVFSDNHVIMADIVVAADGTHSKAWTLVTGKKGEAESSGYSAYRTAIPTELVMKDPLVREHFSLGPDGRTTFTFFPGPNVHGNVLVTPHTVCWVLHHRDEPDTSEESWSAHVSTETAINIFNKIGGWDPAFLALVKSTPEMTINDWRLMWRNPQPQWASPLGRVIEVGDSAHTFLPTSANGATQAIEDAISLANCLQIGGKEVAPIATKVHNKLRCDRVTAAQKMGLKHREHVHKTDWEAVKKDPSFMKIGPGKWVSSHDPERYAQENFAACLDHLVRGIPFKNTNLPPGYEPKPWTIQELLKDAEEGKRINDEGDWS